MRIGVPREIKPLEGRVGLIPAACSGLVSAGHAVCIESGAGVQSGYSDEAYRAAGAQIAANAAELYERGELIVKVKEPLEGDLRYLRSDHILFSYLHLAANPALIPVLTPLYNDVQASIATFWEDVDQFGAAYFNQDASLKYVFGNDLVDAVTIGMLKTSEVDDTLQRMARVRVS